MAAVLDLNRVEIEERIERAAAYLGISGGFDGFRAFVVDLCASLGIPEKLSEMGVDTSRLDELVPMALDDPSCGGNPVKLTAENVRALFLATI
jgi:alcohol dehydrogenase class IV